MIWAQKGTGSRIRIRNTGISTATFCRLLLTQGVALGSEPLFNCSDGELAVQMDSKKSSGRAANFCTFLQPIYGCFFQCCGSMTFWCGSGSTDLCLSLMDQDSDPDPAIFIVDLQDANKKLI
jgi:hypothetical protein